MEQQCRLCFETDETTPFLTPCNCRGTQAYIHTHCLALYMQHYPDGICRVCRLPMKQLYDTAWMYGIFTLAWMVSLAYASTLPSEPRGMYLTLTGGFMMYCFMLRKLPVCFGVLAMCVSSLFLYATIDVIFWVLALVTGLLTAIVLWMYIPTAFLMLGLVILSGSFYSSMIVLYALSRKDPTLAGVVFCGVMFVWYAMIRARPPHRIV